MVIARFLIRYVLPWLAKFFIGRTIRKMQNAQQNQTRKPSDDFVEKKVGNVTVKFNPNKKKGDESNKRENNDDYVDFEEVK
jgi:hypothetical protein